MSLKNILSDFGLTTSLQSHIHSFIQDKDKYDKVIKELSLKIEKEAYSRQDDRLNPYARPIIDDISNFTPIFPMIMTTNHLPDIGNVSDPTQWLRIRLKPVEFSPPFSSNNLRQNNSNVHAMIERKPNYLYSIPYIPKINIVDMFFNQVRYSSDQEKLVKKIMKEYHNNKTLSRTERRLMC